MTVRLFKKNGEITVFLSLLLSSLLALLSISYESARIQFIKLEKETAMDASLRSCFGEYSKDLYSKYDLLYIDSSYKVSEALMENVKDHFLYYYRNNIDPPEDLKSADALGISIKESEIITYMLSSDNMGLPVYNQAVEYMENYGDISHSAQTEALRSSLTQTEEGSILGIWDAALGRIAAFGVDFTNPAESARGMVNNGADQVIRANGKTLKAVPYSTLPSKRSLKSGNYGIIEDKGREEIFIEYLYQKCSSCTAAKENSQLACEMEYLLYGHDADYDNLKPLIERLIRIFARANYSYACSDGGMQGEMRALAEAIVPMPFYDPLDPEGWFDRELLIEAVIDSLECAWAQTEAICKASRLLSGGRVDCARCYSDSIVSVDSICEYMGRLNSRGGRGNTYAEYAAAFLWEIPKGLLIMRFLDVAEINMRAMGNPGLCVDGCIEYMKVKTDTKSSFGYEYTITRDYSYEKKYRSTHD